MRGVRRLAAVGAGLAGLVCLLYLVVVSGQPGDGAISLRVPFVAAFIAAMALAAAAAAGKRADRFAPLLLGLSAAGLLAMGVIAIFSIGVALLVAAIPILVAAVLAVQRSHELAGVVQLVGGLALALAVFVVGIRVTEVPVACPPSGYESGSGPGLFSGPYHWTCVNGRLTVAPGECTRGGATIDRNGHVVATSGC